MWDLLSSCILAKEKKVGLMSSKHSAKIMWATIGNSTSIVSMMKSYWRLKQENNIIYIFKIDMAIVLIKQVNKFESFFQRSDHDLTYTRLLALEIARNVYIWAIFC